MPGPKKMAYTTQAIICLAEDLSQSARARQAKREVAGDGGDLLLTIGTAAARTVQQSKLFLNGSAIGALPVEYCLSNSRLIIFGHGSECSTKIYTDAGWWDPIQLARKIKVWLGGNRIKHISLQMCYGGGYRKGAGALDVGKWSVSPFKSFAYQVARHCGYAETISAFTDIAQFSYKTVVGSGAIHRGNSSDPHQVTFTTANGRYKQQGDKVTYTTTNGASPDFPRNPSDTLSLPSSTKAKPW